MHFIGSVNPKMILSHIKYIHSRVVDEASTHTGKVSRKVNIRADGSELAKPLGKLKVEPIADEIDCIKR